MSRTFFAVFLAYQRAESQPSMPIVDENCFILAGRSYWIPNSFTHTVMESCSSVPTEYSGGSFHGSSLIRRITRRSALSVFFASHINHRFRVLIASIKDMGSCPCPRCLMPKASFNLLGLFSDMQDRITNLRTYSLTRVVEARKFIYGWGHTVNGSKVQTLLGAGSWVPTIVSAPERNILISN